MENKKTSPFIKILIIFFALYLVLFILNKAGYYQKSISEKSEFTKEQMQNFEEDVENNIATDVIAYLPKEKDYSNFLTKSANSFANNLGNAIDNNLSGVFNFIKSLFIG